MNSKILPSIAVLLCILFFISLLLCVSSERFIKVQEKTEILGTLVSLNTDNKKTNSSNISGGFLYFSGESVSKKEFNCSFFLKDKDGIISHKNENGSHIKFKFGEDLTVVLHKTMELRADGKLYERRDPRDTEYYYLITVPEKDFPNYIKIEH